MGVVAIALPGELSFDVGPAALVVPLSLGIFELSMGGEFSEGARIGWRADWIGEP